MIKSMTGYGRGQSFDKMPTITVEMRAVNQRFLDIIIKLPRQYNIVEDKVKQYISERISRGKVEVYISEEKFESDDIEVSVNTQLALQYKKAYENLKEICEIDNYSVIDIATKPDVLILTSKQRSEEELWSSLVPVLESAVSSFIGSRECEGEKLKNDVFSRIMIIENILTNIESLYPQSIETYQNRLKQKLDDVLADISADPQRIATEVAIFADKVAIDEETIRLRSHLDQVKTLLNANEPIGRKLDFIVQEMNREINTIGSKSQSIDISNSVIEVKSEIEKIREQIQNIE